MLIRAVISYRAYMLYLGNEQRLNPINKQRAKPLSLKLESLMSTDSSAVQPNSIRCYPFVNFNVSDGIVFDLCQEITIFFENISFNIPLIILICFTFVSEIIQQHLIITTNYESIKSKFFEFTTREVINISYALYSRLKAYESMYDMSTFESDYPDTYDDYRSIVSLYKSITL